MVYSRAAQGLSDYEANVQGNETDAGQTEQREKVGFGEAGESVPYAQVYHDYRDAALKTLDSEGIPHGLQELVKEYFTSLE